MVVLLPTVALFVDTRRALHTEHEKHAPCMPILCPSKLLLASYSIAHDTLLLRVIVLGIMKRVES